MADYGWVTVTTTCPAQSCSGTNDNRAFGSNGASVFFHPTCPTCSTVYTAKVVITVTGAGTAYVND